MKISFRPFFHDNPHSIIPTPAVKNIPAWFSKMNRFIDNSKKYSMFGPRQMNTTVKWCVPFLDSLSAGYMITLDTDILVKKLENGDKEFIWNVGEKDLVSQHSIDQISKEQITEDYDNLPYKFANNWSIKTPLGYSALFVHPLNRTDLPFYTLSGFVDTDSYHIPVNFPFLLKKDFEGIIPAGTPIAQIIPIKRESWSTSIDEYDSEFTNKKHYQFLHKIYRSYKNQFWSRKDYR